MITKYAVLCLSLLLILSACNTRRDKVEKREETEDVPFSGVIYHDIAYHTAENFRGEQQRLDLDVYLPPSDILKTENPFILFIHGGGFLKGDKSTTTGFCKYMANEGFVVASIDYRLGWPIDQDKDPCESADSIAAIKAFYRAQQDAHTALRFMIAQAQKYAIDTSKIFVAGQSAGAISTLGLIYLPQGTVNKMYPFVSKSLGNLNENGLYKHTKYNIKGIASMWGALNTPLIITGKNAIPTIFFHGERDRLIPFDIDHFHSCENYPLDYGTKPLYERLKELKVPTEAFIDPEGGHGVFSDKFRAEKITAFFNGVLSGKYETGWHVIESESNEGT